MNTENLEKIFAAAYLRGMFIEEFRDSSLFQIELDQIDEKGLDEIMAIGIIKQIPLYIFKKKEVLARVKKVISFFKSINPETVLDVGFGRGTFLFPLLKEFPDLKIHSIDINAEKIEIVKKIRTGGFGNLEGSLKDITSSGFEEISFDVVTMLEVLEHIPDYRKALLEAIRIARRYVVISIPSHPDNNPEHINFWTRLEFENLLMELHISAYSIEYVLNHMIVIIKRVAKKNNDEILWKIKKI